MNGPIEELYFDWLCAKVLDHRNGVHRDLLHILYTTEFVWKIFEDQNRAEDGIELRLDFLREAFLKKDPDFLGAPCSIFEMLYALAKRAQFETETPARIWFWRLMNNLRLDEFRQVSIDDEIVIRDILHTFVWRTYTPLGDGGLFPLSQSDHDQRRVEIWYQFCEYVEDQCLI